MDSENLALLSRQTEPTLNVINLMLTEKSDSRAMNEDSVLYVEPREG